MRKAEVARATRETDIRVALLLEGTGCADVQTGIGFFDHMLCAMARFACMDLTVCVRGDLQVDGHHTVEDTGICIGQALAAALGEKRGIRRTASALVPMDEALALCALDLSGRPFLAFDAAFAAPMVGQFDTQLVEEFFRAVSSASGMTLHLRAEAGKNAHHIIEAMMKAFGRALGDAVAVDARAAGEILSTKGTLA